MIGAALQLACAATFAAGDPVFDFDALVSTPLNPRILKASHRNGIVTEQVMYHSETDHGKDVEIFAFFSYPQGARKLPAFIWNQGGLGQASPGATEPAAGRGYAALCIDFPQPGYRSTGGYPINTGLDLGNDPRQAPIYHGAVALLKAVSYLQSRDEVDQDRIGMAGSSWGGFFTTLMVGVDPRLKVGACVFGSGSLQLGNAWWDGRSRNGKPPVSPADRQRWSHTLDPAWRLANANTPIAWFTGTNDEFYLMPGVMRTYELAAGSKRLMLVPNWHHALPVELHDEQIYAWLDQHLKQQPDAFEVEPLRARRSGDHSIAEWSFRGEASAADLIVSYGEAGNWRGRCWQTLSARIEGTKCTVELPASTLSGYAGGSVVDKRGIRLSTPLVRIDATQPDTNRRVVIPQYDGCGEWGGFEANQIAYLVRHDRSGQRRWIPATSADAKEGKQSAVLPGGTTTLAPILYTATIPHRFTCFMKAPRPIDATLQMAGQSRTIHVGTDWTQLELDLTTENDLMGGLAASITIPGDASALLDAVSFRPLGDVVRP